MTDRWSGLLGPEQQGDSVDVLMRPGADIGPIEGRRRIKKGRGYFPRPQPPPLGRATAQLAIRIQSLVRAATARPASQIKVASPMKGKSTT